MGTAARVTGENALAMGSSAVAVGNQSLAQGYLATATGLNASAIGSGAVASASGSTAVGVRSAATQVDAIAFGSRSAATELGAVALGGDSRAIGAQSVALGQGASAQAANSVALGAGSVADVPGTVSLGSAGAERRLTNLAPGINATDGVNVSQLQQGITGLRNEFAVNMGNVANELRAENRRNRYEARRGIAAVASLTNPPMPSAPGRTTMSFNVSTYMYQAGAGLSVAHRLNTPRPAMLQGGVATGGAGDFVGRVGVAFEF
ncbi:YadA-like family protein [Roseomonas sp. OT10]|nr:YadA-like family protein [Roseomonas sp. OT10]